MVKRRPVSVRVLALCCTWARAVPQPDDGIRRVGAAELGARDGDLQSGAKQAVAQDAQSSGEPLPRDLRQSMMAASLGADLGAVRVRTGSEAGAAAKTLSARKLMRRGKTSSLRLANMIRAARSTRSPQWV